MIDFIQLALFAIVVLAGDWFGIYLFVRYIMNKISKSYALKEPEKNGTTIDISTKLDGFTTFRFYVWGEDVVGAIMNILSSLSKSKSEEKTKDKVV
ncbi:MAG: hypothetical protein QW478_06695 [Candidatus Micrarchaeaceae archaeon]